MTDGEKAIAVLKKMLEIVNEGEGVKVSLEADFGGNTATFLIDGWEHFHAGVPDGTFSEFLNSLYQNME